MATMGAQRPATRLRKLDMPVAVPRIGAGKTSGVYAYRTPYMTFWKNASRQVKASWKLESDDIVKRNTKTPVIAVATLIVPLRPIYLISTLQ
jgi:hypothetical protein